MSLLPVDRATITADEAASVLGIGRNSVYEACQRGELPSIRVGRRLLLPVAKLRALLEPSDQPASGEVLPPFAPDAGAGEGGQGFGPLATPPFVMPDAKSPKP